MPLKRLTRITLLAALCVVLRQAFAFLPNVQPISAIFFLLVLFEDWQFACLVMAVTMFTSAFLLGMSPVVLAQILAFGLLLTLWRGFTATCLCKSKPWWSASYPFSTGC